MKVLVAAVGAPSGPLGRAIDRYEERARRYFDLEVVEVKRGGGGGRSPERAMAREGRALLERVPRELEVFALTRAGKTTRSRSLARYLERLGTYGRPGAAFVLGGAHGLSGEVLERARYRLSLSPMTLSHEVARLVLAEQIYRAGTIIRGQPYHKGE